MAWRLNAVLLGAALLSPLPAAAANVSSFADPGMPHARVARAVDNLMDSAPDASLDFRDLLETLGRQMPVHDELGNYLSPGELQNNPAILYTADPIVAALRESPEGLRGDLSGHDLDGAIPRAREIVIARMHGLQSALGRASPDGDLSEILVNRRLAQALYEYNRAYVPDQKDEILNLYIDWDRMADQAKKRQSDHLTAGIVAGTVDWSGRRMQEADAAADATYPMHPSIALLEYRTPWEIAKANQDEWRRREMIAQEMARAYFALHPDEMLDSPYPLQATLRRFSKPLRGALDFGQATEFWMHAKSAVADLEERVGHILAVLPWSAAGPATRVRIAQSLVRHVERLRDTIEGMYNEMHPGTGAYKLGRHGKSEDPAGDISRALLAKARRADPQHLSDVIRAREDDKEAAVDALIALVDLWGRWRNGTRTENDHEVHDFMRVGSAAFQVMSIHELYDHWAELSGFNGPTFKIAARAWGAFAAGAAALAGAILGMVATVLLARGTPSLMFLLIVAAILGLTGIGYAIMQFLRLGKFRLAGGRIQQLY